MSISPLLSASPQGQGALQLGGRAPTQLRERVGRGEQGEGVKREAGSSGWGRAGWTGGGEAKAKEA